MQLPEEETLRSCDHEDIGDIMLTLANSFNIPVNDMANIVTIGELTTLLQQYGNNHHTVLHNRLFIKYVLHLPQ